MAAVDYGALLRVDGVFVNKNKDLFQHAANTGYVCKQATEDDGHVTDIDGNYFVYAGDEDCMLCFYKSIFKVVSHEKVLLSGWGTDGCAAYTYKNIPGMPELMVSHLDKTRYPDMPDPMGSWEDHVREEWPGSTGKESISELNGGSWERKWFEKQLRWRARVRKGYRLPTDYTPRYLAEWNHNGHHYEVIFGYGIEPNEKIWDEIKSNVNCGYGFTDKERKAIDSWFGE